MFCPKGHVGAPHLRRGQLLVSTGILASSLFCRAEEAKYSSNGVIAGPGFREAPSAKKSILQLAQVAPGSWVLDEKRPVLPPGAIELPGGKAWVAFGLTAQADLLMDSRFADSPGLLVTSSLPVQGAADYGGGFNSGVSFRSSSVAFHARATTPQGPLDIRYVNNFFGASGTTYGYHLRRLYGDWWNFRVGYGYTCFADSAASPATLDFEGPNSLTSVSTPQFRYMPTLMTYGVQRLEAEFAVEAPEASISGVPEGSPQPQKSPDFAAALEYVHPWGHVRISGVLRELVARDTSVEEVTSAWGGGAQLSGSVLTRANSPFMFWGVLGQGLGGYVQDLSGLGLAAL
ncbi:MAG: hypothetical protein MK135_17510, partial [Polyangiaceae bacterium]|nr:hypothetical protein [Polyangiaceae bacterium]